MYVRTCIYNIHQSDLNPSLLDRVHFAASPGLLVERCFIYRLYKVSMYIHTFVRIYLCIYHMYENQGQINVH